VVLSHLNVIFHNGAKAKGSNDQHHQPDLWGVVFTYKLVVAMAVQSVYIIASGYSWNDFVVVGAKF
jgi:hypothetical protein